MSRSRLTVILYSAACAATASAANETPTKAAYVTTARHLSRSGIFSSLSVGSFASRYSLRSASIGVFLLFHPAMEVRGHGSHPALLAGRGVNERFFALIPGQGPPRGPACAEAPSPDPSPQPVEDGRKRPYGK